MEEAAFFLLRVSCVTYNHSAYIIDAMNGFVMQQTSFPFVCTIVDDASTDGQQDVIRTFVIENFDEQDTSIAYDKDTEYGHVTFARHKSNKNCYFAVVYLKENHYSQKKSKASYLQKWNIVKYMAICEGDDYWTDPLKLQKQVDYMEEHEDCCMCCHAVNWETDGELYKEGCRYEKQCDLTTEEVIRNNGLYIATCSLLYRVELNQDRPEWRGAAHVGDTPLVILGTLRGKLHFFPDAMGVYRYRSQGSWTAYHFEMAKLDKTGVNLDYARNNVLWFGLLDRDTAYKYSGVIHTRLFQYYSLLFRAKEIALPDFVLAAKKADQKRHLRFFKDLMIRYLSPLYGVYLHLIGKK